MRPIRTAADLLMEAEALARVEPAFAGVIAKAGPLPLRSLPSGYEGLARIVNAQMISRASAEAIWSRLEPVLAARGATAAEAILAATEAELRGAGLSGAKVETLKALAGRCRDGLDLDRIADLPPSDAIAMLMSVRGIGRWTGEVFLLLSAGHPDIFPAGDVALRTAAAHAFGLAVRPRDAEIRRHAEAWRPHRSIAARLLWAYYATEMRRGSLPVA